MLSNTHTTHAKAKTHQAALIASGITSHIVPNTTPNESWLVIYDHLSNNPLCSVVISVEDHIRNLDKAA